MYLIFWNNRFISLSFWTSLQFFELERLFHKVLCTKGEKQLFDKTFNMVIFGVINLWAYRHSIYCSLHTSWRHFFKPFGDRCCDNADTIDCLKMMSLGEISLWYYTQIYVTLSKHCWVHDMMSYICRKERNFNFMRLSYHSSLLIMKANITKVSEHNIVITIIKCLPYGKSCL